MSSDSQIPDGFEESLGRSPQISIRHGGNGSKNMRLMAEIYDMLGEPEALRLFINGNKIGFVPANETHLNSYPITNNNVVSVTWLENELEDGFPEYGVYPVEKEADLWIVDFNREPIND